jgi:hypothetical protein
VEEKMSPRRKTGKTGENTKDSSKKPNVPKRKGQSGEPEDNVNEYVDIIKPESYVDVPFPHTIKAPKSTKINPEQ